MSPAMQLWSHELVSYPVHVALHGAKPSLSGKSEAQSTAVPTSQTSGSSTVPSPQIGPLGTVGSVVSVGSVESVGSVVSVGSVGSVVSVGSVGSVVTGISNLASVVSGIGPRSATNHPQVLPDMGS